ncbi:MAG: DDE-type integrase/transposase/recombinase, partial [Eggerthellaceae bacterium]|nr:DDE-type integrase/transposase/recombinase [Eggerthellaceae bacterium]
AEEVQVDWAGRTIPIYGKAGETTPAYLFVATMPYSGYTFVRASLDMSMQSWLEQHCALFEFLGGVPMFLAPDNTATAVKIRNGLRVPMKEKRDINRKYQEMADHYGVIVAPARIRRPQDKGAVEANVRIAANRFIEFLGQMRFTSIEQLNMAISKLVEIFNDRTSPTLMFDVSSKDAFLLYEAPFLAPLPNEPFTSVTWVKAKASPEAVITVRGVHYGLPLNYAGKEVRVRIGDAFIDVYATSGQQKIAHHVRGEDGSHTFEGFAGRRPDRFKPLSEWAEQNGRQALINQWHPTKNEGLIPEDIVCLSKKKVWWRCDECGYEWQEAPKTRISRAWDDCLACSNVDLVPGRNDLATLYPEIAAEWHPTKNGCTPFEVFPDQTLNVWWKGSDCGHEWLCGINERTTSAFGRLCPYCSGREALPGFNDVKTLCPELAEIWHPWKNRRKKPDTMAVLESERVFLQKGRFGETWLETPKSWMLRNGYADVLKPFLDRVEKAQEEDRHRKAEVMPLDPHAVSRKRVRTGRYKELWAKPMSLKEWCEKNGREELLKEWHPAKNGPLTPASISHGSGKNVWWMCEKGHEWEDLITHRISAERKCPTCFPIREIRPGLTDLSGRTTSFLKYYSPDNKLPADQISSYYSRALKWECPDCGRKWKASIDRFPEQRGSCPFCGKWVDKLRCAGLEKLDLASRFPQVAAYWHPTKNDGLQPSEVRPYSTAKAWWLCPDCGQEWQESIKNCMYRKGGLCPFCLDRWADPASESVGESKAPSRKRFSRLIPGYNDLATIEPALAAEWHPTKNGTLTPSDVTPGSTAKVWWLCEKGHEWKAEVKHRSRQGTICPHCASVRRGVNPDRMFFRGKTLVTLRPEIIKEWHPTKNGALKLEDIKAGSSRKFWWICEKGHEWEAAACRRSEGTGCPYCSNHRVL